MHSLLLQQVTARVDAVLATLATDGWPQQELDDLIDYLQTELIAETRLKERLLFTRTDTTPADAFGALARDHVNLRYTLEGLSNARSIIGRHDPQELADTLRQFVTQLTDHLSREEVVLARHTLRQGWQSAATARQQHPHAWYSLTHTPVIDVDAFAAPWAAIEAIATRVQQLRPGEHVELVGNAEPENLCCRLLQDSDVSVCCLSSDPPGWRVQVTRRRSG